jgi:hypothetical protein
MVWIFRGKCRAGVARFSFRLPGTLVPRAGASSELQRQASIMKRYLVVTSGPVS